LRKNAPGRVRAYGPGGWFLVGLVFSALTGAGVVSLRRDRLLDTSGQPAVGHVMKLDPVSSENGGGAEVTYRFWIDGDNTRYSHTGRFTGRETPARISETMISGAVARQTIPVEYLPSNPWVNRPDDPGRSTRVATFDLLIPALTATLGWVMCAAGVVKWLRRRAGEAAGPLAGEKVPPAGSSRRAAPPRTTRRSKPFRKWEGGSLPDEAGQSQ
jgi:hypothetical protein